jgi:hypothetical protein
MSTEHAKADHEEPNASGCFRLCLGSTFSRMTVNVFNDVWAVAWLRGGELILNKQGPLILS